MLEAQRTQGIDPMHNLSYLPSKKEFHQHCTALWKVKLFLSDPGRRSKIFVAIPAAFKLKFLQLLSLQKCPEYKFDQVKLGNTVHHYDKYRREMCAAAVIISWSWVDAQLHMQCITNAISLTLCPLQHKYDLQTI